MPKNVVLVHTAKCSQLAAPYVDDGGVHRAGRWDCVEGCPVKCLDKETGRAVAHTFEQVALGGEEEYLQRVVGPDGHLVDAVDDLAYFDETLTAILTNPTEEDISAAIEAIEGDEGELIEEILFVQSTKGLYFSPRTKSSERDAGIGRADPLFGHTQVIESNPLQCTKPVAVLRGLMQSLPGGPVLDPFAGTGSTGIAALREGRASVCVERDSVHTRIAQRRLDMEDLRSECAWKHDDCMQVMPTIRGKSFAAVVSDPPYGCTPNLWDDADVVRSLDFWQEAYRLLRSGGAVRMFGWTPELVRLVEVVREAGFGRINVGAWFSANGTAPTSPRLRRCWQAILCCEKPSR